MLHYKTGALAIRTVLILSSDSHIEGPRFGFLLDLDWFDLTFDLCKLFTVFLEVSWFIAKMTS